MNLKHELGILIFDLDALGLINDLNWTLLLYFIGDRFLSYLRLWLIGFVLLWVVSHGITAMLSWIWDMINEFQIT